MGGVPDLVTHGRNGILFDPANPGGIADAVSNILGDAARAVLLAREARNEAIEKYHPARIAGEHLKIYREILSSVA